MGQAGKAKMILKRRKISQKCPQGSLGNAVFLIDCAKLGQDNPTHLGRSIAQKATIFPLGPQSVVKTDIVMGLGYSQKFQLDI
jgi:hypothetical protein